MKENAPEKHSDHQKTMLHKDPPSLKELRPPIIKLSKSKIASSFDS